MAFEFIKKYFPIKSDSLDDFIKLVEKEGGTSVIAKPYIDSKHTVNPIGVGEIGVYKYCAEFISKTLTQRPIIYDKTYESRFGSDHSFVDSEKRSLTSLKAFITIDSELKEIQKRLPNIETALVIPTGKVDEQARKRIYKSAAKCGINLS
ncbi:MAG: hypothetical protein KKF74_00735 [Nanoarchaeota archaeon]|nr:hypothetical protein [Nanoarchaeota archaeon]